jgi:acyl transferase domain-containing protein
MLLAEDPIPSLEEIDRIQPSLFAIQIALATLWQSWGIMPSAVVGHSMGEVAAAYTAGILTLEEAIHIVCARSLLMKRSRGKGLMMMTELSAEQAEDLLKEYGNDVAIAVINGPSSTVLSGKPEKIKELMERLQSQNLFCKLLQVDVASHSAQMDDLQPELLKVLDGLQPQPAQISIYSTVTGKPAKGTDFNAGYWIENLRKPVLFSEAVDQLLDDGHAVFIEIGPHPVLLSSIQHISRIHHRGNSLLASLRKEEPGRQVLLDVVGSTLYRRLSNKLE